MKLIQRSPDYKEHNAAIYAVTASSSDNNKMV